MKIKLAIIFLVSISTDAFSQIGLSDLSFNDRSRNRQIDSFVFYPTKAASDSKYAENIVFEGFSAKKDGPISKGKFPLYILAHGTSGNWKNLSWLAKELSRDAIVVSANYPTYTTGQASPESILKPWNQPKDVSFIITKMLEGRYSDSIDSNMIVVIGHSLGGYTAMAVSGAVIDLGKYTEFCSQKMDKSCEYFDTALKQLTQENIISAKQSFNDKRVSASIALAPGFTESMTEQSLKFVKNPILVISAEEDKNVPPDTHLLNIPKNIQQYQVPGASHFSFMQVCKPGAIDILAEEKAEFVCKDGSRIDRSEIHQEVLQQIRVFLSKNNMTKYNK